MAEDKIDTSSDEYQTSFMAIYGRPGPPTDEPHVNFLGKPTEAGKESQRRAKLSVIENPDYVSPQEELNLPVPKEKKKFKSIKEIHEENKRKREMEGKRIVTLKPDNPLSFEQLYRKIFIAPDWSVPGERGKMNQMFARAGCWGASSPLEADIVVFGGGTDVEPSLYGAKSVHDTVHFCEERDNEDIGIYLQCLEEGIPMIGICRGAQFLHVMNGGKLFQDVDGHYGQHAMWDRVTKERIYNISSVHHQLCMKQEGMDVIGVSMGASKERYIDANTKDGQGAQGDIEAFFYRETCCLGVQGHPEYDGYNRYTQWFIEQIQKYIVENVDLIWVGEGTASRTRMDPELLKFRRQLAEKSITLSAE